MKVKRIDGILLDRMLRNGLANLQAREREVNDLNVFPVADGDTATNMCRTLDNGIRSSKAQAAIGAYLKQLSSGMLLGARGNSGVILSQIFKGVFQELAHAASASAGDLRNAFIRGYKTAYAAVAQPTEGTVLTVAREGVEHIRSQVDRNTTVDTFLAMYLAEMRKTLSHTPEMLPVLKEAGVIDSGGLGYILIVEGMLKFLHGEKLETAQRKDAPEESAVPAKTAFNENSVFEEGYCMEFILQLMNNERYMPHFRMERYVEGLKCYGSSIVTVQDGKRVKVHIHTHVPGRVIDLSQDYGEFISFKLDNMQLQHNEQLMRQATPMPEHKPLAIIAVVNGEGMRQIFSGLGCDFVIDGGETMNTSSEEFIDVFRRLDADRTVVLPNNKNTVLAAEQAVSLFGSDTITVLPTASMVEGYFALAMDLSSSSDVDFRLRQMREGAAGVDSVFVTAASRDYSCREISCRAGDQIALVNGELVCVSDHWLTVLVDGLNKIPDMEDKESCIIFQGAGQTDEALDALTQRLDEAFPLLEKTFINGGQSTYEWMLGIV